MNFYNKQPCACASFCCIWLSFPCTVPCVTRQTSAMTRTMHWYNQNQNLFKCLGFRKRWKFLRRIKPAHPSVARENSLGDPVAPNTVCRFKPLRDGALEVVFPPMLGCNITKVWPSQEGSWGCMWGKFVDQADRERAMWGPRGVLKIF